MNKNLDKQLAQVFENDYPGYEYFVEKVINLIFTGDDTYEAFQSAEDLTTDEKRRRKANESGIQKILKVGEINTPEPIEVFDITLKDDKDLQYNRVGIQSFIRSELFVFTNAFMLFHNENPEGKDWRFSFAYKDTNIKGMTPAKRYTYLFGKNHRARTASERFAKLADAEKDTQNLLNAFSVEALSKDFFNGYKEQYKAFCDFLFAQKDDREYFGPKFSQWEDKYLRDYVKKMMGRITFIYFLQRKGWMNNDLDYMQKAFENSTCKDDYLDSFLEPLFCGVLNTKPEERAELFKSLGWNLSLLDGWNGIPYLNGGLFERDEQDKPKSKFPAQMFKNLFDFYSRYNFTIYENDPDDAEVGIDPEMLGHIFENLLEDNKDKGAFYTPKEIVQYMSRESIAQYLKTHADEALHTAIDELIKDGKVGEALQDKANATAIYRLLCDVKVCDPAIGSGAFPMGVLNVLYHARMLLYAFTRPTQGFSPAAVKREIIQNNIYGVDIEKGAVDIARLRFWLALVVDEEEPQPLPNLDYKIMCGNSLIHRFALDAPFKDVLKHYNKENKTNFTLDDYRQWVYDYTNLSDHTQKDNFRQKIEEIKHAFRTELSMKEIDKLSKVRGKIEDLQSKDIFGNQKGSAAEIKKMQKKLKDLEAQRDDIEANKLYENAFEWRFEFPALLNEDGNFTGFDVVIGNPPYVNMANIRDEKKRKYYQENYSTVKNKCDLYSIFTERAKMLLKDSGILGFIFPNSWMGTDSFSKFREFLANEVSVYQLVKLPSGIFEEAIVTTVLCFYVNTIPRSSNFIEIYAYENNKFIKKDFVLYYSQILKNPNTSFAFEKTVSLENVPCKALGEIASFSLGIKTSDDARFVFKEKIDETCYPFIRGRNISRWSHPYSKEWLWYQPQMICEKPGGRPRVLENFLVEKKIVIQDIATQITATIDSEKFLCNDTLNIIYSLSKGYSFEYILCLLNSKLINVWFKKMYPAGLHIKTNQLEQIPIPFIDIENQNQYIYLANTLLELKSRLQDEKDSFFQLLCKNIGVVKISGTISKFEQMNFSEFTTELHKQKKQFSDKELNKWEQCFNQYSEICHMLSKEIEITENRINILVYHLYGLTYDEVLVVDPETEVTREEYEK